MSATAAVVVDRPVVNAMSVDVEDYFQVSAFDGVVPRSAWETRESRVVRNTERLLAIFDQLNVRRRQKMNTNHLRYHPELGYL